MMMKPILLAALVVSTHGSATAQMRRGGADDVYAARRDTGLRPLRDIENGVVPGMKRRGAAYIGAEYDGALARYRLKFMREGAVIWIDVDGHSGAIVARAGD